MSKNRDIQALRGVAVLLVFVQHYRLRLPTPGWYLDLYNYAIFWGGVDLFFVISGFVIAKSLMDRGDWGEEGRLSYPAIKRFWVRRFNRLVPTAWFWVVISSILGLTLTHVPYGGTLESVAKSAASAITATSNIYWSYCVTEGLIGNTCINPDFNAVYWSLSLEEQFYFIFAIIILFIPFRSVKVLLLAAFFITSVLNYFFVREAFSLLWVIRPQGLILGVIIAIYRNELLSFTQRMPALLRIFVSILSIAGICIIPIQTELGVSIPVLAIFAGVTVSSALPDNSISRGALGTVLQWVGDRSYSLYLCHLPIILVARELIALLFGEDVLNSQSNDLFIFTFVGALLLSLLTSNLSYRFIENNSKLKIKSY